MDEIIFLDGWHKDRCHAKIVDRISVEKNHRTYVGEIDGYEIYKTYGLYFDQFGFEAVKKEQ